MPLSVSVGLSRKAARNYQSTGVAINLTAELDPSLLDRPEQLQQQIRALYAQAEQALKGQVDVTPAEMPTSSSQPSPPAAAGFDGQGPAQKAMSDSQRQAILAIARRLGMNPELQAYSVMGTRLEELSRPQASKLINYLRGLAPADPHRSDAGH